ncbi:hypothetical protein NM208_g11815 [Fusarium decemcellulare]|uniref:Uncharacterized protein n=1 Tax=Fusarium decemcellulare TaxID=57161 RepID=A0ACC1RR26_9HYPO|nr:hypothetical protein NM208_g11815 [Fusarium decemcellulare]
MSTFNGIVSEFPDIRIDFFRRNADSQPPLACFLSHVHSDHLAGLESLRSPFVYCSAATREILLRLERYPCRINYAKGILEARQQTYKHLNKVLKSLPLETPTTIELRPDHKIQVTLFDANHCPGAVMFLIEGDGKAVLYTGDIRSEPWFVNTISRNPNLVEYTSGLKILDKIYLDTSFIEDIQFQTKAQGIAELLRKVSKYPNDTVFHFQAWTYGYEDVWVALSKTLKSQTKIHVDDYKLRVYGSLKSRTTEDRFSSAVHLTPESPALTGHMCGNTPHQGCLTADENVRIHSCEKGSMCEIARRPTTVTIQPVIAHLPAGQDLAEVGVGGGGDDLQREAELDFLDQASLATLVELILSSSAMSTEALQVLQEVLMQAATTGRNIPLDWDISTLDDHSAEEVVLMLAERLGSSTKKALTQRTMDRTELPKTIHFPYSRHSSYPELCHFVEAFQPKDVWPCTVSPSEWLRNGTTIASLFGQFCSGGNFEHDILMESFAARQALNDPGYEHDSQTTVSSRAHPSSPMNEPSQTHQYSGPFSNDSHGADNPPSLLLGTELNPHDAVIIVPQHEAEDIRTRPESSPESQSTQSEVATGADHQAQASEAASGPSPEGDPAEPISPSRKRNFRDFSDDGASRAEYDMPNRAEEPFSSTTSEPSLTRQDAYRQMLQNMETDTWTPIRLISTSSDYTATEKEL